MAVLLYVIANMNYLMFVFDWDLLSHPLILLDVLNIFKGKRVDRPRYYRRCKNSTDQDVENN